MKKTKTSAVCADSVEYRICDECFKFFIPDRDDQYVCKACLSLSKKKKKGSKSCRKQR